MAPVSLPPGFRFHPTDEELVTYYLHSKIKGKSMELDIISEIDLYRYEPWDLPDKSFLPSKDMEWYFFSTRDRKYPNGSRTNRATKAGYWKATGKDRTVYSNKNPVGVKKTLVFYGGRAPHGVRTNWVMHEYRIVDSEPGSTLTLMDSYALCRVFKKIVQKTISIDKQVDDQEEDWQLCQIQSVFDHNIRDNGLFPPKDEKDREEEEVRFLSEFRSDASSSEITQGTSGDDFFLESTRMAYRIDEENSSTTGFFPHIYSASQCTKERTMMDYTRMEHQIPYPPLTTVNFSRMNSIDTMVLQEQENGEYITEEKYKNCWNQGNLEEIISVLCSSHANSNCQPSQCF